MVLLAAWGWLSAPTFGWAWDRLSGFGLISFLAAAALALLAARREGLSRARTVVIAVCAVIVAVDRVHTLSFAAAAVGSVIVLGGGYRMAVAALVMMLSLPTIEHLEAFFGFHVRAVTAEMVARVLGGVSSQSVILLENGIADVAEACSGMRTLTTGALGFAWLWLLQKRMPSVRRALVVGAGACAALVGLNALRVLVLVWIEHVVRLPEIARIVHAPLGVLGFAAVMVAAFLGLRERERVQVQVQVQDEGRSLRLGRWALFAVVAGIVLRPIVATPAVAPMAIVAPRVNGIEVALERKEKALFERYGARAFKYAMHAEGRAVQLVLVASDSYRAHHAPEVCAAAHGERVERFEHVVLGGGVHATTFLTAGKRGVYWFERRDGRTTDALFDRVFSPDRWVLVSMVIAGPELPPAAFVTSLRASLRPLFGETHAIASR